MRKQCCTSRIDFDFSDEILAHTGCLSLKEAPQWAEIELLMEKLALDLNIESLYSDLLKMIAFIFSIPVSNWTDKRNRISVVMVKAELQVRLNFQ